MRVISLITQKGGSGKSTLAVNIAAAAEAAGERVLLLDCDPQETLSKWCERRVAETPLFEPTPSAKDLTAALKLALEGDFTLVIIDTPGVSTPIVNTAITRSDFCLIPTRPSPADLEATTSAIEAITVLSKPFGFVLNQIPPRGRRSQEAVEALSRLGKVAPFMLANRTAFQDAMGKGLGVVEWQPKGKAADEVNGLWRWVVDQTKHLV